MALRWAIDTPDQVAGLVGLGAVSNPWEGGLSPYYPIMGHPVLGSLLAGFVTTLTPERVIDASLAGVFAPQAVPDGYGAHFGVPLTLRRGALLANARQVQTLLPQVVEMVERYGDIKAAGGVAARRRRYYRRPRYTLGATGGADTGRPADAAVRCRSHAPSC